MCTHTRLYIYANAFGLKAKRMLEGERVGWQRGESKRDNRWDGEISGTSLTYCTAASAAAEETHRRRKTVPHPQFNSIQFGCEFNLYLNYTREDVRLRLSCTAGKKMGSLRLYVHWDALRWMSLGVSPAFNCIFAIVSLCACGNRSKRFASHLVDYISSPKAHIRTYSSTPRATHYCKVGHVAHTNAPQDNKHVVYSAYLRFQGSDFAWACVGRLWMRESNNTTFSLRLRIWIWICNTHSPWMHCVVVL